MARSAFIGTILALAGCSADPHADMKTAVKAKLIDPQAAEFREIGQQQNRLCGDVRSQTLEGAHVWRMFIAWETNGRWHVDLAPSSNPYPMAMSRDCGGYFMTRAAALCRERLDRGALICQD
jgi:hypothetical protein